MKPSTEYSDTSTVLRDDCISHVITRHSTDGTIVWHTGNVITPDGMVEVLFSEPRETIMRLVHNRRIYKRRWRKGYRPRYLTNLARRFAADVVAGQAATP